MALFAYHTTVSNMTGTTPFKALFGVDSQIPLDVIFPGPPPEAMQWPAYVRGKQHQLQKIYCFMREKQKTAVQRATAYQSGRVTKATKVEEGDVVYYFAPRVIRSKDVPVSWKLAPLWTGPYKVVKKVADSLAKITPFGKWAKNSREIVTTVDKLRVVRGLIPEEKLRPREKLDLDEIEEDLKDYSERIRDSVGDPQDEIDGSLQLGPGSWKSGNPAEEDMEKGMMERRMRGQEEEEDRKEEEREAKEEAGKPNDPEEMEGQIMDQCPGQVPL